MPRFASWRTPTDRVPGLALAARSIALPRAVGAAVVDEDELASRCRAASTAANSALGERGEVGLLVEARAR